MSDRIERTAEVLADLRRRIATVVALDADCEPTSVPEAYAVQDRLITLLGGKIVGWKVGATAPEAQAMLGVDHPFAGPLFAASQWESGATLKTSLFTNTLIESEFAFRFGQALSGPVGTTLTREDVLAAVDAVVPAIEIIAPCFEPAIGGPVAGRIADLGVSAGLVQGRAVTDWSPERLPAHGVSLKVAGVEVAAGTGAKVLGDPVNSLVWLANHLIARGRGLAAGDVVTTGTTTGIYKLAPGQTAVADFGSLGEVRLTFEG